MSRKSACLILLGEQPDNGLLKKLKNEAKENIFPLISPTDIILGLLSTVLKLNKNLVRF